MKDHIAERIEALNKTLEHISTLHGQTSRFAPDAVQMFQNVTKEIVELAKLRDVTPTQTAP